jgi:mediator of RNA polymerase II transcription subunit 31
MLDADEEKRRFQIELEFIQCLSNPWYLNSKLLLAIYRDSRISNTHGYP